MDNIIIHDSISVVRASIVFRLYCQFSVRDGARMSKRENVQKVHGASGASGTGSVLKTCQMQDG